MNTREEIKAVLEEAMHDFPTDHLLDYYADRVLQIFADADQTIAVDRYGDVTISKGDPE